MRRKWQRNDVKNDEEWRRHDVENDDEWQRHDVKNDGWNVEGELKTKFNESKE